MKPEPRKGSTVGCIVWMALLSVALPWLAGLVAGFAWRAFWMAWGWTQRL